jgi:hypothetical protein
MASVSSLSSQRNNDVNIHTSQYLMNTTNLTTKEKLELDKEFKTLLFKVSALYPCRSKEIDIALFVEILETIADVASAKLAPFVIEHSDFIQYVLTQPKSQAPTAKQQVHMDMLMNIHMISHRITQMANESDDEDVISEASSDSQDWDDLPILISDPDSWHRQVNVITPELDLLCSIFDMFVEQIIEPTPTLSEKIRFLAENMSSSEIDEMIQKVILLVLCSCKRPPPLTRSIFPSIVNFFIRLIFDPG